MMPAADLSAVLRFSHHHRPGIVFGARGVNDHDEKATSHDDLHALLTSQGDAVRPVIHQHLIREPVTPECFRACRLSPFIAFNFFATPTIGAAQG